MTGDANTICGYCVMDRSDPHIAFDREGVCCHCCRWLPVLRTRRAHPEVLEKQLTDAVQAMKEAGRGRDYDCLLGLSGGVDSSYLAVLAQRYGLRVLAVHFDNGWNSELAVQNIRLLMDQIGFDLETYVIDWEEFRDLQRAFFQASVIDIEMLTDHAIAASLFRIAGQRRIRHILSGYNVATESGLPQAWYWNKQDLRNIRAIHARFGTVPLSSFPTLSTWQWIALRHTGRFRFVELLNLMLYEKRQALRELTGDLGWRYYGGKHYESVFTRFYQAYVLPVKFGVDKRRAHLSSLIRNGEMTRDEALNELKGPPCEPGVLKADREYVLKKLGYSEAEFAQIMALPVQPHSAYASDQWLIRLSAGLRKWLRG